MLKELALQYLEYLEIEKNRSQRTIRNYSIYLNRFLDFAKISKLSEITPPLIRRYRIYLNRYQDEKGKPLKKVTQNHHLIVLRNFLRHLQREGHKVINFDSIELMDAEAKEIPALNREKLLELLNAPNISTKKGLRDKVILETLFSTGMRVSELATLNKDHIDLKRREFSVVGKRRKVRLVFISDRAADVLDKYLKSRGDHFKPLFIRYGGKKPTPETSDEEMRLSVRSIQSIVEKYARQCGFSINVTPHVLRHTYATDLLLAGADLRSVQELLGHSDVSTTQIYTQVTNPRLREVYRKHHLGNRDEEG